jgi:hypothetical protein
MEEELFRKTISEAARGARVRLRQLSFSTQAPDHPILWGDADSYYLKFFLFQLVRTFHEHVMHAEAHLFSAASKAAFVKCTSAHHVDDVRGRKCFVAAVLSTSKSKHKIILLF